MRQMSWDMPRKQRIEFEGAFYNVITRGNQRWKIFKDSSDFHKFNQDLTIYKNAIIIRSTLTFS